MRECQLRELQECGRAAAVRAALLVRGLLEAC